MRFVLTDRKSILLIIFLSLMVYIPYILSFDSEHSDRHYWTGDSWWYMQIVESMVQNGDLDISNNIPPSMHVSQSQLALSAKGYLAPKHGIFFPLVSVPFYLLFGNAGYPLFNLILTIGILILLFQIIRVFFDELIALTTTLIYAFSSVIFLYSYNYLADLWSVMLMLFGIKLVLQSKYYGASIFIALAIFAKVTNVVWVAPIFIFIGIDLWSKRNAKFIIFLKEVLKIALIFLIMILPVLVSNYLIYGSPFITGYQRIVSYTMDGNMILLAHTTDFNNSFFDGLSVLFFDSNVGILWDNYVIIIAVLGIVFSYRIKQRSSVLLLLSIVVLQLLFFSKYNYSLATEFGNRFLYLSIVLSSVFVANIMDLLQKKLSINSGKQTK